MATATENMECADDINAPPAPATATETSATNNKPAPRFVVKKWNAVTFWSWDICTDTCAICRNKLYEPSIEAQANPGIQDDAGYSITWGVCGHVFHLDCISRWLKTRSVCPLCNREWEFSKMEKIAMYNNV